MGDVRRWFTWYLLSTGKVFERTIVVFVLFRFLGNSNTSHSIVMVFKIAQAHWCLFNVKLGIMLVKKGSGFINAKLSTKTSSLLKFQIYTTPLGQTWCVLQGNWKSQSVLKLTREH